MKDAFETARLLANKSDPLVTRYIHASVILDRKGRIIGQGKNHYRGKMILSDEGTYISKTVHSEVHALEKVDIRRLNGATMINYGRTNVAAILSRPCNNCLAILKKLGFRKIFYTIRSDIINPRWQEEYLWKNT